MQSGCYPSSQNPYGSFKAPQNPESEVEILAHFRETDPHFDYESFASQTNTTLQDVISIR